MKTIRMPKALGEAWLAALRSGEYRQATNRLCDNAGGYCCLGVLQMVAEGEVERYNRTSDDLAPEALALPTHAWLADHGVWFDPGSSPAVANTSTAPWLPMLGKNAFAANDHGVSFNDIADAIEDAMEYTDA